MMYTDTRDSSVCVNFRTAVLEGMNAKTGGLYVPAEYPALNAAFLSKAASGSDVSFTDIAYEGAKLFAAAEIPDAALRAIVADAYPFAAPLVRLDDASYVLELFHGPTCAFKDFGARFMARVMAYFNKEQNDTLHILVATSGDTGSAVGSAFQDVPGIDVTILFPQGKISPLQEKQLSTFTGNIRSLRVEGTFDDCQKLVKTAFTDGTVREQMRLSSANSINISRLLPQSFYYIHAAFAARAAISGAQQNAAVIAVVPSGNFGDLTSGLIAQKMGAPITGFVAATNANKTIPDWICTGAYRARPSVQTYSNAMDVGTPSNYERITSMYSLDAIKKFMAAFWINDEGTLKAIHHCKNTYGYLLDPHGAVGYAAWQSITSGGFAQAQTRSEQPGLCASVPEWAHQVQEKKAVGIMLETAHPAKFGDVVKKACGTDPELPERLQKVLALPDKAVSMQNDYGVFRDWLLATLR